MIFNAASSFKQILKYKSITKMNLRLMVFKNKPKTKDGAYLINLDEFKLIGTYWIALYKNNENVTYFDGFGVEHVPKEF